LIKEKWIHSLAEVVIKGLEVNILEKIKIARGKNEKVVRGNEWQVEILILKKEKVYVPKDKESRVKMIQLYYNILEARCRGR